MDTSRDVGHIFVPAFDNLLWRLDGEPATLLYVMQLTLRAKFAGEQNATFSL